MYYDKSLLNGTPICGWDWLNKHGGDVTEEDINNQTLEASAGGHKLTVKASLKNKDLRTVLATLTKEE